MLKIYKLPKERSDYLLSIVPELPSYCKFKHIRKKYPISIKEWRVLNGYLVSLRMSGALPRRQRKKRKPRLPLEEIRANYKQYLKSPKWKALKQAKFEESGRVCEVCSSEEEIIAHHLRYRRRLTCKLSDLMVLCTNCHDTFHRLKGRGSQGYKKVKNRKAFTRRTLLEYFSGSGM